MSIPASPPSTVIPAVAATREVSGPTSSTVSAEEWLSALADGQADALEPALRAWSSDGEARAAWHRTHLIGDVLRSSELAPSAAHVAGDADFLHGLRTRLAAEPAILAPAALRPPVPPPLPDSRRAAALAGTAGVGSRRSQPWLVPLAAAAGVAVVAGLVVVSGVGRPGASVPILAVADPKAPMLRNAELDEYLRMHRLQRGAVVPMMPGSGLQQTDLTVVTPPSDLLRADGVASSADGRR